MNYIKGKKEPEINAEGVEYDSGSVFERLGQLTDIRKARGKRFSLETILTIIAWQKCVEKIRHRQLRIGQKTIRNK